MKSGNYPALVADFKKLEVWQKAHALSLGVDRLGARIRNSRYASLRSQMFRAAMSISANIAEGRSQNSEKEFGRFLGYALHSSTELEHHLIVARDVKVIAETDFVSLTTQTITVRKMLYGLLKRISTRTSDVKSTLPPRTSTQQSAAPPTARSG